MTRDPMKPTVMGVGYMGHGPNRAAYDGVQNPAYNLWGRMLARCYSGRYAEYEGVTVCERWLNFQNFAEDVIKIEFYGRNGYELDKDILEVGCKIYSPRTCCFVPSAINNAFKTRYHKKTKLPLGITLGRRGKYESYSRGLYLGSYSTVAEAYKSVSIARAYDIIDIAVAYKYDISKAVFAALLFRAWVTIKQAT